MVKGGNPQDEEHYDTVRRLEGAAENRFHEAEFLAEHDHYTAATYLFGYAAEMWVKAACYRLEGYGPNDKIQKGDRGRLAAKAPTFGLPPIGPHDLFGWARLILELKHYRFPKFDLKLPQMLVYKAQAIVEHWHTELRYEPTDISEEDLGKVQEATTWIRSNRKRIVEA